MTTLYFLALALVFSGPTETISNYTETTTHLEAAKMADAGAPDLECPPDMTVNITEMSCTKDVNFDFPSLPGEFVGSGTEFYIEVNYEGISTGQTAEGLIWPEDYFSPLSGPPGDTTIEFWGGSNHISILYYDDNFTEFSCGFNVTVLDSVPPQWPTDTVFVTGTCGEGDPFEVYLNSDFSVESTDNCCAPKQLDPELVSQETVCGNSTIYTYLHITGDGSGDPISGMSSDAPCIPSFNGADAWFDTLVVIVTMEDIIPPVISGVPADVTIGCSEDVNMPTVIAADSCEGDLTGDIMMTSEEMDEVCGNGQVNTIEVFTWTVTDPCGNTSTETWTVSYENTDDFTVEVTGGGLECMGSSRMLDAGAGGQTYTWSTGANTQTIEVTEDGIYSVTVTTSTGCCSVGEAQVLFGDQQSVEAQGGTITCNNSTVTISAGINSDMYLWSGPNGFMSDIANPTVDTVGEYFITVTSSEGCTGTGSVVVDIDTAAPDLQVNLGAVDCAKETVAIQASSVTDGVTYQWTGPDGFESDNPDTSARLAGSYNVVVTAPNGCTTTDAIVIGQDVSRPTIAVKTLPAINGTDGIAWVEVTGGTGPYEYAWSNGSAIDSAFVLLLGKHSVTVTDANSCIAEADFYINPAATVCDLLSTRIGTNSRIDDTLTGAAPYIMYNEFCVDTAFDDPDEESLFARSFLFQKTSEQNDLTLKLRTQDQDKLQVFIFQCELLPEYNAQFCDGVIPDSAALDLDPGFYYITVIGSKKSPYQLIIEEENDPITLCKAPSTDISCGVLIDEELGDTDNFNVDNGAYQACYRGGRAYTGPENVYVFEVRKKSAVEFKFNSQSEMGVFLYDFECTGRCISAFESLGGNEVSDAITLNQGYYYIVVDQADDLPGKGFTLQINCAELEDSPWPDRRTDEICYDENSIHQIRLVPNQIELDRDVLDSSEFVRLFFLDPDGTQKIGPGEPLFLTNDDTIMLAAYGDDLNLSDTCGYVVGEPIGYRLKTGLGAVVDGQANYISDDSISFRIGGSNTVSRFIQKPGSKVSITRLDPAEIKDRPFDATMTKLSIQANQDWIVDPFLVEDVPWITDLYVEGSSNPTFGSGNGTVIIEHTANPDMASRTTDVNITFTTYGEVLTHTLTQGGDTTSAVHEIQDLSSLSIYPNPASGQLTISARLTTSHNLLLSIKNILGQTVDYYPIGRVDTVHKTIDISSFNPGVYFVSLEVEGQLTTRKIVISND